MTELRLITGDRLKSFLLYSLYVVIVTAALVAAAVVTDTSEGTADSYRPGFGDRVCWFSRRRALLVFFAVPLMVVMVLNVLLFVGSALIVRRAAQSAASITCGPSKVGLAADFVVMSALSGTLEVHILYTAGKHDSVFLINRYPGIDVMIELPGYSE